MTLKQIAALGRKLSTFLALFSDCFGRRDARGLLRVYVKLHFRRVLALLNGIGLLKKAALRDGW